MPTPVRTPRLNNNDDIVRLARIHVDPGAAVQKGDALADVETDKATFVVEADEDGFVLRFQYGLGETVPVGSVLLWMGSTPDEPVPQPTTAPAHGAEAGATASLKATLLLQRFGVRAADVSYSGERLTAADVLEHARRHGLTDRPAPPADTASLSAPQSAGRPEPLSITERAMLRTVSWHQREAVPAYLEIDYAVADWESYAGRFQAEHKLLLSPLLGLMAYRLATLAKSTPRINTTLVNGMRYVYDSINLGFTVQSGTGLYLVTIAGADAFEERAFVDRLNTLQRKAMKNRLEPSETSGATLSFTSMARWNVLRHQPILPPHHAMIVAHSAPRDGVGVLGATYDHRVLTGAEVIAVLNQLKNPPRQEGA